VSLTADQIKQINDKRTTETVRIPEWDGDVIVGVMSCWDRDDFVLRYQAQEEAKRAIPKQSIRAVLAAKCCVDERGERIFKDADIAWLSEKNTEAIERIWDVACKLNGIRDKDIDDTAKNLPSGQNGDSRSVSPEILAAQ